MWGAGAPGVNRWTERKQDELGHGNQSLYAQDHAYQAPIAT